MRIVRSISTRGWAALGAIGLWTGVAACGEDPVEVEFEVISETTFGANLGIDLPSMNVTNTGVYWADSIVGAGPDTLNFGERGEVSYVGWLSDGTQFDMGQFSFDMGANQVVPGFEDGLLGMLEGGQRLIIIPPERGYGGLGNGPVPPGAIMVFLVELIDIL